MSDTDENDQNDDADLEISDEDAERLLSDAVETDDDSDTEDSGRSTGKSDKDESTHAEVQKWRSLARKHEREAKARAAKLREYEDANKSEAQRLQDSASEFKTRAERAEAALRRREIAEERAPAHATPKQIAWVARRIAGESDEDFETDADDLFAQITPAPPKEKEAPPKTAGRPRERLRPGNADPEEDDEEMDARKLADMIRRNR